MTPARTFGHLFCIAVCLFLLAAGCAPAEKAAVKPQVEPQKQIPQVVPQAVPQVIPEEPPPPPLALKFTPQDSASYKVITEVQQTVEWKGAVPAEPAYTSGSRLDRMEMVFTQQIQSVDDKGNAVAKITIEGLKYHSKIADKPSMDFNSTDPNSRRSPIARLVGQSYTIEIAPTGELTKIIDTQEAYNALGAPSYYEARIPFELIEPAVIRERHGTLVLPQPDKNCLRAGDKWSSTKTFFFGPMGSSSYEKIYTLKEIKDVNNPDSVVAVMSTIPAPQPQDPNIEQTEFDLLDTFDKTGTYTGWLKFDSAAGKVEKYSEKLESTWSAVIPPDKEMAEEPVVLIMGAVRLYDLEKID